jgi:high-affinity iron transporter
MLEGLTLLLAAAVLVFVGHWLLAKADVVRWKRYLEKRLVGGAGAGSALALGLVSFLAVYREGVETVLFYRALLSTEGASNAAIVAGLVAGLLALAGLCYGIYRFGVRIPLRPFFAGTSAVLLLLAFVFAGKGVHELQEARVVSEARVPFIRLSALGIYPTVETLATQALVLVAIALPAFHRARRVEPTESDGAPKTRRTATVEPATAETAIRQIV